MEALHSQTHAMAATQWDTPADERVADAIVHGVGLVFAAAAGTGLLVASFPRAGVGEFIATALYVAVLFAALTISLIYNQWPLTPAKPVLRRVDHSAIYMLIAVTYTPFLAQMPDRAVMIGALVFVWTAALSGMAIKVFLPGRFDRAAIAAYLLVGWSGVALAGPLSQVLSASTLALIAAGGVVYSIGVIFYTRRKLRFQTALWHGFVVVGAALHCFAVMDALVFSRL